MKTENILEKRGVRAKIAKGLGGSKSAPYHWTRVPADRLIAVAKILDMHPREIRPDLYPPDEPPAPPSVVQDSDFASMQHIGD